MAMLLFTRIAVRKRVCETNHTLGVFTPCVCPGATHAPVLRAVESRAANVRSTAASNALVAFSAVRIHIPISSTTCVVT